MSTSRVNSVFGKKQRQKGALDRFSVKKDVSTTEDGKKEYAKYVERKEVELKALKSRV